MLPEPGPKLRPVRSISTEASGSIFRVPGLGQTLMAVCKRKEIFGLQVIVKIMKLLFVLCRYFPIYNSVKKEFNGF